MKTKVTFQVLILLLLATFAFSAADKSHKSIYTGEENREIKSLSVTDIEDFQNV